MSLRNLDKLFKPGSVALFGADREGRGVGAVLARNLIGGDFQGPVLPVHPELRALHGVLTYKSTDDLPLTPDLAVIASAPEQVPELIERLGRMGTKAAVVASDGFVGSGVDGADLQRRVREAAKPHVMRVVGPNSLGLIEPRIGLNASYGHVMPKAGDLAFVSQSGTVLSAVLDFAAARGIGFSHALALGDTTDVDFGDALDYLASDPRTKAVLLYVENVKHARKFMSAARATARVKPVLVVKAGASEAGATAALSHTGASAGEDAVYDAAIRRAGMLRVSTLPQLFAAAETLGKGVRVQGRRLAIVSNGGGMAVIAADMLAQAGGDLAALDDATLAALEAALPKGWNRAHPVDLGNDASPERYAKALGALAGAKGVDAVLALHGPTALSDGQACARAVVEAAAPRKKPLLASWVGEGDAAAARDLFSAARLAAYPTPSEAVTGFAQLVRYKANQEELTQLPLEKAPELEPERARARRIVGAALESGREWLSEVEAKDLLKCYGVPSVPTEKARGVEEAVAAAERLSEGFWRPVALKILSSDITHKSDVGGVALGLGDTAAVREAARAMLARVGRERPGAEVEGFSVQPMVERAGGVELLVGAKDDPTFGPVVAFGSGGIATEILEDTALDLVPLNLGLAHRLMARTRAWRQLQGYRGREPLAADEAALALVKVSQLMTDLAEVAEIDVNPLLANALGVTALDARVRVAKPRAKGVERLAIRPYPRELERLLDLKDGRRSLSRPIRPEDAAALQEMIERSNPDDLRLRFFSALRRLPTQMAARLTQIDYDREMAFVALAPDGDEIWGVSRLHADPDRVGAEYSILVRSDIKGLGLGWRLMERLIEHGGAIGLDHIHGEVLTENRRMLEVCQALGFELDRRDAIEEGIVHVKLPLGEAKDVGLV